MSVRLPWYLRPLLPPVGLWVAFQARRGNGEGRSLASLSLPRLPAYFSRETLEHARLVVTGQLPRPPLPTLGLERLRSFAQGRYQGLTLDRVVFVEPGAELDEGVLFHELVHVVQWRPLGRWAFLHRYGRELLHHGYAAAPLEQMAYALEARFRAGAAPFDAEAETRAALDAPRRPSGPRLVVLPS